MENNTENKSKTLTIKEGAKDNLTLKKFEQKGTKKIEKKQPKKPVKKLEKKPKKPQKKTAFVALIGEPNAGKSTLINRLVGSKISIVTPKVQTTRTRVNGIVNIDDTQIVFIDTPGIFKTSQKMNNRLNKTIVQAAIDTLEEVDFIALLVDVKNPDTANLEKIFTILSRSKKKKLLLINKVDLLNDKSKLFEVATMLNEKDVFDATFMISALKNDGVENFTKYVAEGAKPSPWHYAEDEYTNVPERLLAAEITREKLLFSLDKEIPYKLMVETESWVEGENSVKINQVIYTETEAHKKIIVGKHASNLKRVGAAARKDISHTLGRKVHLFLFVKVTPDWINKRHSYEIPNM
jgi:GTP-binding protein Era